MSEADRLLKLDYSEKETTGKRSMSEQTPKVTFNQHEFDGFIDTIFNGNKTKSPGSLSYSLLRKDKEGALNSMRMTFANKDYGEGKLRRMLMEYNMVFNNDYTFYSYEERETLKEKFDF